LSAGSGTPSFTTRFIVTLSADTFQFDSPPIADGRTKRLLSDSRAVTQFPSLGPKGHSI
jgi:hypothetical protein